MLNDSLLAQPLQQSNHQLKDRLSTENTRQTFVTFWLRDMLQQDSISSSTDGNPGAMNLSGSQDRTEQNQE